MPAPLPSKTHLIAKPVNGHMIEAVPCADTQGYYKGRWLVVERDRDGNEIELGCFATEEEAEDFAGAECERQLQDNGQFGVGA